MMNVTSTPITVTSSKKRELQSPEDLSELKKNRVASNSEPASESDISDLSIMSNTAEKEASETASQSVIRLDNANMETIAELLKVSFQPQLAEMVGTIVNGVLEGLQTTVAALQSTVAALQGEIRQMRVENNEMKSKIVTLETKADAAEQYSRRNCLRVAGVPEPTGGQTENTDEYVIKLTHDLGINVERSEEHHV